VAEPLQRITKPTRWVLEAFLQASTEEHYGLDIAAATALKSGSLYPILGRLEDNGWLTSRWEDIDPATEGRPRRRYYRLTPDGHTMAKASVATANPARGFRWQPGSAT
jgi:PadR family transcriptional regulator, regulatory protein PadR